MRPKIDALALPMVFYDGVDCPVIVIHAVLAFRALYRHLGPLRLDRSSATTVPPDALMRMLG